MKPVADFTLYRDIELTAYLHVKQAIKMADDSTLDRKVLRGVKDQVRNAGPLSTLNTLEDVVIYGAAVRSTNT